VLVRASLKKFFMKAYDTKNLDTYPGADEPKDEGL
jgi:hypothetical protein